MNTTQNKLNNEFSKMILSASGWRKVFAVSGNQEDRTSEISDEDKLICTAIATVFCEQVKLKEGSLVFLAQDARPTGNTICSIIAKVMKHRGINVEYAGICSAPEAMAQSTFKPYSCFVYISASHNPIGHNGVKLGVNGGVFDADTMKTIISAMREKILHCEELIEIYNKSINENVSINEKLKEECLVNYRTFVENTTSLNGDFSTFADSVKKSKIGVVADLNGSARAASIDKDFLNAIGVKTCFINDIPGNVVHGIVPEGKNLQTCCDLLEKKHREDPDYILGYVPDNDGDRGNLVYIDSNGKARILKAQEVFALCVSATLRYSKDIGLKNVAVAVNCATSMRIDEIAEKYGANVFRAEVGEANVVSLADNLRTLGYSVPILGEGANGGNITYPARVRDPMNTLMCMFRLISNGSTIVKALEELPVYTTSDSYEPEAIMHLETKDFKTLKAIYEKNFPNEWNSMREELKNFGIVSYLEYQTEGIKERQESGKGDRGGLKMMMLSANQERLGYIWMRPSGTEPLLRILTDVKGDNKKLHDILNNWQRKMIQTAESELLHGN